MKIKILDAIECEISKRDGEILIPLLSFEAVYWQQGPHTKKRKTYLKQVFSHKGKNSWYFYTGLLPRVKAWCKSNNIPLEIEGEELKIAPTAKPFLKGITFREDQLRLIDAACKANRGIIVSATGSGKTLMQLGVISCYPKSRALILAHTTSIVAQTFKELKDFGFKDIEMFGAGNSASKPKARITVSTMQTWIKLNLEDYMDRYDILLLDEAHHLQQSDSTYSKILSQMLSPIRLGWTATTRTNDEAILISEGLLGPVLDRVTIDEAAELNILARPKLRLIKAKCSPQIMDIRKYQDVYTFGIVENKYRNRQIVEIVEEFFNQEMTTLIFVTQIEHGLILVDLLEEQLNCKVPFVRGEMPEEQRTAIKNKLITNKIKVVVATTSWREGVDIPNLSTVVLSGGGKSEIQTLQGIGRGLRKTKDKDEVLIIDFLDLSHTHLIRQTGERLAIYSENSWI